MELKELDGFKAELKEYWYLNSVESQQIDKLQEKIDELQEIKWVHEKKIRDKFDNLQDLSYTEIKDKYELTRKDVNLSIGSDKIIFTEKTVFQVIMDKRAEAERERIARAIFTDGKGMENEI